MTHHMSDFQNKGNGPEVPGVHQEWCTCHIFPYVTHKRTIDDAGAVISNLLRYTYLKRYYTKVIQPTESLRGTCNKVYTTFVT